MFKIFLKIIFLFILTTVVGQNTTWNAPKDKIVIPFQSVFNLIVIPVEINDVKLNMIFDTGSEHSLVFSFADTDSIQLHQTKKTKIFGLGKGDYVDALISVGNKINCNGLQTNDFQLLLVLEEQINMSAKLGITVNGILSASLFKNYVFSINYSQKTLTLYKNPTETTAKKYKKYQRLPISVSKNKPFVRLKSKLNDTFQNISMLMDTGLSDAVWLFENDTLQQKGTFFTDHLGTGIGGEILGKRALIKQLNIGTFEVKKPLVAFPEAEYFKNIDTIHPRNGSIGGDLLSRFSVVFDYSNHEILLKKNHKFSKPFAYNKTGIEVQHNGIQWVKEEIPYHVSVSVKGERPAYEAERFKYQFVLKPIFEIASIRKNSSAEKAGLKVGDVLTKINKKATIDLSIEKIMKLFHDEDTEFITLEILRNGQTLNFSFEVESLL